MSHICNFKFSYNPKCILIILHFIQSSLSNILSVQHVMNIKVINDILHLFLHINFWNLVNSSHLQHILIYTSSISNAHYQHADSGYTPFQPKSKGYSSKAPIGVSEMIRTGFLFITPMVLKCFGNWILEECNCLVMPQE